MVIDEKIVAEEIAKELGIPIDKVTSILEDYKGSIKESIREFRISPTPDFKIFMPRLLTFKCK